MIGGKLVFPGEGREEEEEEEGETEGGGVSCWKGERSRGDAEEEEDDMVVVVAVLRSDTSLPSCNTKYHHFLTTRVNCGAGVEGHEMKSILVK